MILHGNQRGGGRDLAAHLLKPENERIVVLQIRGFVADNLKDAFVESFAISKATQCKQHLFSVSINPPTGAGISDDDYLNAADNIEAKMGLTGQPRAIVRHWKRGDDGVLRSHAHAVWCRIDASAMKAIHLPFSKLKLREVSRELHKEQGLQMPSGLVNSADRDPRNFTLEQWQQCKRAGKDIHRIKEDFHDAWSMSDSRSAFAHALEERGYVLARGRRGFVAVDYKGEIYAIRSYAGVKSNEIKARLRDTDGLPSVDEAKAKAALTVAARLNELRSMELAIIRYDNRSLQGKERRSVAHYRNRARRIAEFFEAKKQQQEADHLASQRKGLFGLWDRLTGRKKREIEQLEKRKTQLERESQEVRRRERDKHLLAVKALHERSRAERMNHFAALKELRDDVRQIKQRASEPIQTDKGNRPRSNQRPRRRTSRSKGPELDR